ncbi:MAG: GNAT family N-acetyltransferase [Synergistaceae bacterium]|nr:GNAT family N-acetyltransferase [Synergistaceae bacterium]
MSDMQHFTENFISAARMLGNAPGGDLLLLRQEAGAFASGMPFAGENYALFDSASSREDVSEILDFFTEKNLPFVSLQLPELKSEVSQALESRDIFFRAEYLAMSIRNCLSEKDLISDVRMVSNKPDEGRWAEAAWTGFDGDLPVPDSYNNFASYLNSCPENHLYYLEKEGIPARSALLHSTDKTCGLYYFATRPESRRQGLARKFMDVLIKHASLYSDHLVLLATEAGAKMYINYGFKTLLRVPVFSGSDEI